MRERWECEDTEAPGMEAHDRQPPSQFAGQEARLAALSHAV